MESPEHTDPAARTPRIKTALLVVSLVGWATFLVVGLPYVAMLCVAFWMMCQLP